MDDFADLILNNWGTKLRKAAATFWRLCWSFCCWTFPEGSGWFKGESSAGLLQREKFAGCENQINLQKFIDPASRLYLESGRICANQWRYCKLSQGVCRAKNNTCSHDENWKPINWKLVQLGNLTSQKLILQVAAHRPWTPDEVPWYMRDAVYTYIHVCVSKFEIFFQA